MGLGGKKKKEEARGRRLSSDVPQALATVGKRKWFPFRGRNDKGDPRPGRGEEARERGMSAKHPLRKGRLTKNEPSLWTKVK